jgi:hypothetical protein
LIAPKFGTHVNQYQIIFFSSFFNNTVKSRHGAKSWFLSIVTFWPRF